MQYIVSLYIEFLYKSLRKRWLPLPNIKTSEEHAGIAINTKKWKPWLLSKEMKTMLEPFSLAKLVRIKKFCIGEMWGKGHSVVLLIELKIKYTLSEAVFGSKFHRPEVID